MGTPHDGGGDPGAFHVHVTEIYQLRRDRCVSPSFQLGLEHIKLTQRVQLNSHQGNSFIENLLLYVPQFPWRSIPEADCSCEVRGGGKR